MADRSAVIDRIDKALTAKWCGSGDIEVSDAQEQSK